MGDGSSAIAPGAVANINVATAIDVYVRVRDMTGRPLKGAVVTLGGVMIPSQVTDESGLAVLGGVVGTSFTVSASYTALFGAKPGSLVASKLRTVSATAAFDPSPPTAPDPKARRELHTTVQIPVYYPLKRLFGWQSPILRAKIYMDAVSVAPFTSAHPKDNPDKNRLSKLNDMLALLDPSTRELEAAKKQIKDLEASIAKQKQLLVQDGKKHDADSASLAAHDKKVAGEDASKLSDAARARKEKRDAERRGGLQKKVDQDDELKAAHLASLEKSEKSLADAATALEAAKASHGGSTHRQMMEYVVDRVLPKTGLDDWIKYGIIHLTGLRYRPSGRCCYPPGPMVYGMREKEIDEREHPSSSAQSTSDFAKAQRVYAREYLALLKENPELAKSAAAFYPRQKAFVSWGLKARPYREPPEGKSVPGKVASGALVESLERLARSEGPWVAEPPDPAAKGKRKPKLPTELYELRAIASSVCQAWLKSVGAARAGGIPKGPPDENALLGEIVDRWFQQQIPEVVWNRAVRCTQLIHDFVEQGLDMAPADWNRPKVPPDWERVFTGDSSAWLRHHDETMQPYVTGVVCNDVASILARARGLPIGHEEFIMGIAHTIREAGQAADKARQKAEVAAAAALAAATAAGAPAPPPLPAPARVGLFRPQTLGELKSGDIIFFGHWVPAADADKEVHIIPPRTILDLGPSVGTKDDSQFGAALSRGILDVKNPESLAPTKGVVVYGVQRDRPHIPGDAGAEQPRAVPSSIKTDAKKKKKPDIAPADRIVRAWLSDPKPKKGEVLPDPPPPPTTVYDMLTYQHIATVIEVREKYALCLETAQPVGVTARNWETLSGAEVFFGRLTPKNPPDLSWFLSRDNLLAKGRLDDG